MAQDVFNDRSNCKRGAVRALKKLGVANPTLDVDFDVVKLADGTYQWNDIRETAVEAAARENDPPAREPTPFGGAALDLSTLPFNDVDAVDFDLSTGLPVGMSPAALDPPSTLDDLDPSNADLVTPADSPAVETFPLGAPFSEPFTESDHGQPAEAPAAETGLSHGEVNGVPVFDKPEATDCPTPADEAAAVVVSTMGGDLVAAIMAEADRLRELRRASRPAKVARVKRERVLKGRVTVVSPLKAASEAGVWPLTKPVIQSTANAYTQTHIDRLWACFEAGDRKGIEAYPINGSNTYARILRQLRDVLLADMGRRAAVKTAEAGEPVAAAGNAA